MLMSDLLKNYIVYIDFEKEKIKLKKRNKFELNKNDLKSMMRVFKISSKLDNYGYDYKFSHTDIDDLYFIFNNYMLLMERVKKYAEFEEESKN